MKRTKKIKICSLTNVYNSEEYLEYTLKSIYNWMDQMVIIDGRFNKKMPTELSTDNTDKIVTSFPDPDKKIIYLREPATKQTRQRDKVFRFTKGFDFLFICDDDEVYKPEHLRNLRRFLRRTKKDGFKIGGYTFFNSFDWYRYVADPRIWRIKPGMYFVGSNNIYRKNGIYDRSKMQIIPGILKYHYSYVRKPNRVKIRRHQTSMKRYPYHIDEQGYFIRPEIIKNLRLFNEKDTHPEILKGHPYRSRIWNPEPEITWDKYYWPWKKHDYSQHIPAWKGFCNRITRFVAPEGKVLEVGCGTGMMSIYINKGGWNVTGLDSNAVQVQRAKMLNKEMGTKVRFINFDVFKLNDKEIEKFDLSFSQGLLEHFTDEDIKKIIKAQFKISPVVAFSVPLDKFGHQSRGDERLLSQDEWKQLIKGYKIVYWSTFAKEKQLICVIKNHKGN